MRRLSPLCAVLLVGCLSGEGAVFSGELDDMAADQAEASDLPAGAPDQAAALDMPTGQPDLSEPPADMPPDMSVDMGPVDPCASIQCGAGATCAAGVCRCSPGFSGDGTTCTPESPGDTALRTREQVCQRWRADYGNRAQQQWQLEPMTSCEVGVLHPDVVDDALRRMSLFRWLVGLGPVTSRPEHLVITQACATTLAASNRGLSHSLDNSWTCYSDDARAGAGSSNIAMGVGNPADSVDLYIQDRGVPSLGHRRWIFNPPMGATGFGQRGAYSCMYSFDQSAGGAAEYVAYPAPGFFPQDALLGVWSFSSSRHALSASSTVSITTAAGAPLTVSNIYVPDSGYGQPTLAWSVAGAQPDVEYIITLDNIGPSGPVTYRTTLVGCP